jgi:hypothetical protein
MMVAVEPGYGLIGRDAVLRETHATIEDLTRAAAEAVAVALQRRAKFGLVLLAVDDLEWLDDDSVALLGRRCTSSPCSATRSRNSAPTRCSTMRPSAVTGDGSRNSR